jgi:hypothetical protein
MLEVCNGFDDDCDGTSDEGLRVSCYTDADSDGYGTGSASSQCRDASRAAVGFCPAGYSNVAGDCNDGNGAVRPMATEVCNSDDDDCDGMIDEGAAEGAIRCYLDTDGDGYGVEHSYLDRCSCPTGYVNRPGIYDCFDTNSQVRPNQTSYFATPYLVRPATCNPPPLGCVPDIYSWDYNCNGADERQPRFVCTGPPCVLGRNGPSATYTATACGTSVPHTDCGLGCTIEQPAGNLPLRCR